MRDVHTRTRVQCLPSPEEGAVSLELELQADTVHCGHQELNSSPMQKLSVPLFTVEPSLQLPENLNSLPQRESEGGVA